MTASTTPNAHLEPLRSGLMMIHGNRMETLRELVVQWLKAHPLAPLENEVFLVQSNGMAQWLKLALAADDGIGIAAALQMQLPSRFIWQLYRQVLGPDSVPKDSPFDKPLLRWRLLRLLPTLLPRPEFAPLQRFLADDPDLRKRDQLAEQLADLFDQYQVYRSDWLAAWSQNRDVLISADGRESPLPEAQLWQGALWRAILADMDEAERHTSRATLHQQVVDRLQAGNAPAGLPRRIVVFGISTLPSQMIEVLAALARHCQILLCVQNPCQHFWGDIIEQKDLLRFELNRIRHGRKPGLAAELDPAAQHAQVNPLLAAWGKQGRDYIGMLYGYDQPEAYQGQFESIDLFEDPLEGSDGRLLHQLQAGVFQLEPTPNPPVVVSHEDESVRFTLAHSRQREVEILQDHLLKRFAEDPELTPTDIIVMMPDVSQYAPHIEAVFGQLDRDDTRYLPYTIADRPQRGHHVLVLALERLLGLNQARFTVSELLDLLAVPALRARFGIDEGQLPLLQRWVEDAGVRWGLDSAQRASFDLPDNLEQNTWAFGLKRMLLGYAVGQGDAWAGIEPFEEIGGLDAALVGGLARLLTRLETLWSLLAESHTPGQWVLALRQHMLALFLPQDEEETVILARLDEALAHWLDACEVGSITEPLPITVAREICLAPFGEEGVSQRFLAGKINFCTLMPMRAIPFKQVCLLGLNDEDYPRSRPAMDFDMLAAGGLTDGQGNPIPNQYRPGDRSRREDDRYLFLEALMAARDQIYFSYVGRNARDNGERTPSVLLGQLQDHLKAGYQLEQGGDLLTHLTTLHPLQPFSRAYFGESEDPRLHTYAREWFEAHQGAEEAGASALAPWLPQAPIVLADLVALLRDPVKLLMTRRLGIWFGEDTEAAEDLEPFALDGLVSFQIRDELMTVLNQHRDAPPQQRAEALSARVVRLGGRGQLPLGAFAELATEHLAEPTLAAFERARALSEGWQETDDLECHHKHGPLVLEDWLSGLYQQGGSHFRLRTLPQVIGAKGQLKNPMHALDLYLGHLAGCAGGLTLNSYLVGADTAFFLAPIPSGDASQQLSQLMEHYLNAMTDPLPVAPRAALAYLAEREKQEEDERPALDKAATAYEGGFAHVGDRDRSPYLRRQFPAFADLPEEAFATLAHTLYQPLREMEEVNHGA
ncbi:exodeoxyribonuclease V subunit gamma [Ferrimonas balearica]|uniref:exodeoxyribonuclease V subunit gamma n=1 Tax=Ferrimonas balearica TaxID=44012 RepID=UPI001C99E7F5|nr:exodeoxyribonuclease V subunit gamma [Ferrimonas balearica]MBY5921042.1 exodeoxyribonuclease V subunit gamma [Ferrimonas balearica]MBY5996273.1 exodeoxyribonuclease V subunit gamma [Ferrimonas balearica]